MLNTAPGRSRSRPSQSDKSCDPQIGSQLERARIGRCTATVLAEMITSGRSTQRPKGQLARTARQRAGIVGTSLIELQSVAALCRRIGGTAHRQAVRGSGCLLSKKKNSPDPAAKNSSANWPFVPSLSSFVWPPPPLLFCMGWPRKSLGAVRVYLGLAASHPDRCRVRRAQTFPSTPKKPGLSSTLASGERPTTRRR